jgi:magnesium chelatase subunit D
LSGAAAREVVKERGRRTLRRDQLAGAHRQLEQVSPEIGRLDEAAFGDLLRTDADAAVALLADLAAATDPQLRAQARRLAARLFVRAGRLGSGTSRGYRRLSPGKAGGEGDLDLDLTLEVAGGRPKHGDELIARRWTAPRRALCLLVDHSGSMRGHAVGLAAMATSAVVLNGADRAGPSTSTSVIAFAADALVLQRQGETRAPSTLIDDLLSLRGKGRTDLALALRTAARELAREPAAERVAIVLSDCRATAGDDPLTALRGLDRVDVLGTDDDPDAVAAGRRPAARARGRYFPATRFKELQSSLLAVLA